MGIIPIQVDSSLQEKILNRDASFPVGIWTDVFDNYIDGEMNCHWHDELEFGLIKSGRIDYWINGAHLSLQEGDCVFINTNVMHMAKQSSQGHGAVMITLTFPASLFTTNAGSTLYRKYFYPILHNALHGFPFSMEHPLGKAVADSLSRICLLDEDAFGYELNCLHLLAKLWYDTISYIKEADIAPLDRKHSTRSEERAKSMMSFIHTFYSEPISITDIAGSVGVSQSECFRCFKYFTNKKPIEYVNEYRLAQAAGLLWSTDNTITEICSSCGFASSSYFGKLFKQKYGLSPQSYRKRETSFSEMD